jgi:membrane protein YdbS with pleckstrin-like domain
VGVLEVTTIIMNWFAFQLTGLWPLIWHFGLGGVALIICGLGWYFSPAHKVDFIWAAVIVIVVIISTAIGVSVGEKRKQAQWDVAREQTLQRGKQARVDGVRDAHRKPSRWLQNKRDPDLRD